MPRDAQISNSSSEAAPKDYTIPGNAELVLRAVTATFTDNGASGDWLPCLTLISDSGHTIARACDPNVKVTAGGDAEVSWFPGVKASAASAATTGAVASAYLTTFTPVTFTGSNTYTVAWPSFQTTDPTVFGTNHAFNANTPPHNATGDFVLVLLKDGAYCLQTTLTWSAGTVNAYGGIQNANPGYAPIGNPNATNDLATVTAPYTGNGNLLSQDTRLLTIPAGDAPAWFYLEAAGATATNYTMTAAKFLATWFGPGIGADHVVY